MAKRLGESETTITLSKIGLEPIYSKNGVLIYEIGDNLYMLTNTDNQFNYTGNKVYICGLWPDWCN